MTWETLKKQMRNIVYAFLIFSVAFCISAGISAVPYHLRYPLIIVNAVICALLVLCTKAKWNVTLPALIWTGALGYIFISACFSYKPEVTLSYAFTYLFSSALLFFDFSDRLLQKILQVINLFCTIIALSILLCAVIGPPAGDFINFFINPLNHAGVREAVFGQFESGAYFGLAKECAAAAFVLNVGLATVFAELFSSAKIRMISVLQILLFLPALLLTVKRTLYICPLVILLIFIFLTKISRTKIKYALCVTAGIGGLAVLSACIPQVGGMYQKLISSFLITPENNRFMLASKALEIFLKKPVFGSGFGTYNQIVYDAGLYYNDGMWENHAHNVYLQVLCENGIVGFILLFTPVIMFTFLSIKHLRSAHCSPSGRYFLLFALYIQLLCFLYSCTGNVLFNTEQIYTWIFAMAVTASVVLRESKSSRRCQKLNYCFKL